MALSYEHELSVAELAVQRAIVATKDVLDSVDKGTLSKDDGSPVSLADFAGQALLIAAIHHAFPADHIVGEEAADALRNDAKLMDKVWSIFSAIQLEDQDSNTPLSPPASPSDMLDLLDLGGSSHSIATGRVWMVDPIDGTKRFIEGGQYTVIAALLVDGEEKVAVIGCPHVTLEHNRISESDVDRHGAGYLVSAVKGRGAKMRPLSKGVLSPLERVVEPRKNITDLGALVFVENVETMTPVFEDCNRIAERLGATWPPVYIFSTQLKYVACALGICDVYMRAPRATAKAANVWDHAGGIMIFEEAGGKVTDLMGNKIVLSVGRRLSENFGIIAAPASVHSKVVEAAKEVLTEYPEYASLLGTV